VSKLWVDNVSLDPMKLVVYDANGAERIVVTFSDFEYNVNLGDELFRVQ
jgi:outer membrane lipoprotein-sorting protein